jgi:hypothetical protein
VKAAARLVAVAGAAVVAWMLFRAAPREVTLVYETGPREAAAVLEVRIQRGPELLRRAEFRLPPGGAQVRHTVRLRDGRYQVRYRLAPEAPATTAGGPVEGVRDLEVSEGGTIVLALGP